MQTQLAVSDLRSTVAAALLSAHRLAPVVRAELPPLLDRHATHTLSVLADRLRDGLIFDPAIRDSLSGAHSQIDKLAGRETRKVSQAACRPLGRPPWPDRRADSSRQAGQS